MGPLVTVDGIVTGCTVKRGHPQVAQSFARKGRAMFTTLSYTFDMNYNGPRNTFTISKQRLLVNNCILLLFTSYRLSQLL